MKKKKINIAVFVFVTALFTLSLLSCDFLFDFGESAADDGLPSLKEKQFYAQDMSTSKIKYYILNAELLAPGEFCEIWVEAGSPITVNQATDIAAKYDQEIRGKIVDAFGMKNFNVSVKVDAEKTELIHFDDILEYANWLAGGGADGKLTILLLNIKDGYIDKDPKHNSYVAGYFFSGNFWPSGRIQGTSHYSNARDMIYIDTSPGLDFNKPDRVDHAFSTFAHELQHLINYVTSILINRGPGNSPYLMDLWIDEGLASQAEYIYLSGLPDNKLKGHPEDKLKCFFEDSNGTLAQGNNFFVWDNRGSAAIMDEYSTVYLFFRWLYLQADSKKKETIFRDIIESSYCDQTIIVNIAKQINGQWDSWEAVLRAWIAANYYPENAAYGYKGDNIIYEYFPKRTISGNTISLYPGEGVYSIINVPFTPKAETTGKNIRYAGIKSGQMILEAPYTGEVLLTYNILTEYDEKTPPRETGNLTGISSIVSRTAGFLPEAEFIGPFVIDARDLWGQRYDLPPYAINSK